MNAYGKNLLSVVSYGWTEWVIFYFLFLLYLIPRFDGESVPSCAFTIDAMSTYWSTCVCNIYIISIWIFYWYWSFIVFHVSLFIFEQCLWLNSGWEVVTTISFMNWVYKVKKMTVTEFVNNTTVSRSFKKWHKKALSNLITVLGKNKLTYLYCPRKVGLKYFFVFLNSKKRPVWIFQAVL